MYGTYTIKMIQGIVDLLTLFTDEGLYEPTVILHTDHCRDITLQLCHLTGSPGREVAESHLIAFTDDVIEFIEDFEINLIDKPHLFFENLGLHHRVEQYLVGALDGSQYIETLHQVGHTHIVMSLSLLLTSLQQLFVQQPVGMLSVEGELVGVVGIRVDPDGILTTFEDTTEDGC